MSLSARIAVWLVLSYKLGILLVQYIDAHVLEAPRWVEWTVRLSLQVSGYSDVQDPETIGALCGLFVLSLCWISIAIALLGLYRLAMRYSTHRN